MLKFKYHPSWIKVKNKKICAETLNMEKCHTTSHSLLSSICDMKRNVITTS